MLRPFVAATALFAAVSLPAQTESKDREERRPELHKRSGDAVRAVSLALDWLVRHQRDDGSWHVMHDEAEEDQPEPAETVRIGITGLAVLALQADGNTSESGPYARHVERGLAWLIDQQDPATGLIGPKSDISFIYGHAIATLTLAEAAGFDARNEKLRDATEDALAYLERHRNPYAVWRYSGRDGDNDASVTSWCTMALVAAEESGFEVRKQTKQLIVSWFDEMTDPANGRTGYSQRGGHSSRHVGDHATRFPREHGEVNTAIAVLCRALLGESLSKDALRPSIELLMACPPRWDPAKGTVDEYYWFFGSHAMHQVGGESWETWSDALYDSVVPAQRGDGPMSGSWDPVGVWAHVGGRVYSTALTTLSLQSAYRLARVSDAKAKAPKGPKNLRDPRNQRHGK